MVGFEILDGFIDFAKVDFKCPYCKKEYDDSNDFYLNRCNKNKKGYTKIKCSCGEIFGFTYNHTGDAVGFSLKEEI